MSTNFFKLGLTRWIINYISFQIMLHSFQTSSIRFTTKNVHFYHKPLFLTNYLLKVTSFGLRPTLFSIGLLPRYCFVISHHKFSCLEEIFWFLKFFTSCLFPISKIFERISKICDQRLYCYDYVDFRIKIFWTSI